MNILLASEMDFLRSAGMPRMDKVRNIKMNAIMEYRMCEI
jgi:hypothetical protein